MKNFISRFQTPFWFLVAFVAMVWVSFPYLFSNEAWEEKGKIVVKDFSWTTELVGTANDFPDTKIVNLLYDETGNVARVFYLNDILSGEEILRGDTVYMYALSGEKLCMSHYEIGKNYELRWKYYWYCDQAPVRNGIIFILFVVFIGTLVVAIKKE